MLEQLKSYSWPGNVREVFHHVERIALFSDSAKIPKYLWLTLPPLINELSQKDDETNLQTAIDSFKKQHILKVLATCRENQTEAAKRLGIGRTYLNRLLSSYKEQK